MCWNQLDLRFQDPREKDSEHDVIVQTEEKPIRVKVDKEVLAEQANLAVSIKIQEDFSTANQEALQLSEWNQQDFQHQVNWYTFD